MAPKITLRPAEKADSDSLSTFLSLEHNIHRHLDWRTAQDWLGHKPFWLLAQRERILAALACPLDPVPIAWIRLFAASRNVNTNEAWRMLFQKAAQDLTEHHETYTFAAVALRDWFSEILQQNQFTHHQDIIVLEWENHPEIQLPPTAGLTIRYMQPDDVPAVTLVDNASFAPLWQNSLDGIHHAFRQSAYATVAEIDGEIVAYQMSTRNPYSAHLARLAVLPHLQGQHIGHILMADLITFFSQAKVMRLTVNTQSDNLASIGLYQKFGFRLTGETFPVFLYQDKIQRT